MTERDYYLAFSNFSGVGPVKFKKIVNSFGSAKKAWSADADEFGEVAGKSLGKKLESFRNKFDIEEYKIQLNKQKIDFVTLKDQEYPENLRRIPTAPFVLYLKGNKKLLSEKNMISIVGTRHITHYGREITKMFAGKLAESELVIVSGLAYGVDGVAHKACLNAERGKTIAVLGNGVDLPYPRENTRLYEEILDKKGLIISELPPGTPPSIGSFPSRNRIVAGLSQAVLVTEGASDSGSLITANHGLEYERKVFAVPGPVTSSLSAAPLRLIEKGAKLVVSPEDIIKELGIKNHESGVSKKNYVGLSKDELKIIKLIENESLSFDEIVRAINLDSSKTASILTMMEIKGIVKNTEGGYSIIQ